MVSKGLNLVNAHCLHKLVALLRDNNYYKASITIDQRRASCTQECNTADKELFTADRSLLQ